MLNLEAELPLKEVIKYNDHIYQWTNAHLMMHSSQIVSINVEQLWKTLNNMSWNNF